MKIFNVQQGTDEWANLRAGIPTASEFSKLLTPTGKVSTQADGYMLDLLAERFMGHPIDDFKSSWMERGQYLEPEARSFYEFQKDITTERVGFMTNDQRTVGASPDSLVGPEGLLEIKCPSPGVHIGYLLRKPVDSKYYPQIQGQLWISGRKWLDILSYHPEIPPAMVRVDRDEEYIEKLANVVMAFSDELERQHAILLEEIGAKIPLEALEENPELSAVDIVRQEMAKLNGAMERTA